jgi:hypothetical protein
MKSIKKLFIAFLCLAMLLTSLPFSAVAAEKKVTYVKGANNVSDSYKNSVYYEKLMNVTLTGDGRQDLLAVALSQLGYQESGTENDFDGKPSGSSSNYTEYNYNMGDFGVGYGGGSYAWCAAFVAWCLLQSGCTTQNKMSDWCRKHPDDKNYIWREVGCPAWASSLRTHGYWQYSKYNGNNYVPQSGDLIFFSWDGAKYSEDHIGIVVYSDGSTVYTIEGNTADAAGLQTDGGGVYFKSYPITSSYICGYGVMPYKTASGNKVDHSGKTVTGGTYITDRATPVYSDTNYKSARTTMPRYTTFEILRKVEGGYRISYKTAKGSTVNGFIKKVNNAYLPINYGELLQRGDLDGNNDINAYDYIRVKRSIFQTLTLDEKEAVIADVNDDTVVNQFDYILIKRHVMKTYTIKN